MFAHFLNVKVLCEVTICAAAGIDVDMVQLCKHFAKP